MSLTSNLQDRWWCGPFFGMYSIAGENWTVWNSFATLWTFRGHGCLNAMFFFFSELGYANMDVVSEISPGVTSYLFVFLRSISKSWCGKAPWWHPVSSKSKHLGQEEGIFQPWISEYPGFNYEMILSGEEREADMHLLDVFIVCIKAIWEVGDWMMFYEFTCAMIHDT